MAKFKAGDKVVMSAVGREHFQNRLMMPNVKLCAVTLRLLGGSAEIITDVKEDMVYFGDIWIYESMLEHYQESQQFNLKTRKWWIATPTPEISKAVQEWLFEHGISWKSGSFGVANVNSKYLTNIHGAAYPVPESKGFMQTNGNGGYYSAGLEPEYEIKITTKTIIDSVTFPNVISEQEKARKQSIAELEATIAKAQQQIEQLKSL